MIYLEGLNDRQKEAVLTTKGPVSVLAGAGSGKTRVLTTRIYHLIRGGVAPEKILAVTFTNKAAREMRERLGARLGEEVALWKKGNLPFVATFHGLGRELLETYGRSMSIPRHFSIFDRDDSERAVKAALKELGIDPKEVPPRAILSRISKAKGEGQTLTDFKEKHARESFRSRITADAWQHYEETLAKERALDFDDLLEKPVRLLETDTEARQLVQERFHYIHIDEYQDTNELQGRLVSLLAGERRNLFVVGDIDQCLVAGTKITMSDHSKKPIESIRAGDLILSNYGSGDLRPALVTNVHSRTYSEEYVCITTEKGRELRSTPEHIHFAGYRLGLTPQLYFTYLMYKRGTGWRLGVSKTYTNGQIRPMVGFQQRCSQEHGDSVWVVGVHQRQQEARVDEYKLSLLYGIPTLPFVARKGSVGGYVHDQAVLDEIFRLLDTEAGAERLLADKGLSGEYPHHHAQATRSDRRNITITLCGERRGKTPMHRLSMVGSDAKGHRVLTESGFPVRSAKRGSTSWRFETAHANFGELRKRLTNLKTIFPEAHVIENARLGGKKRKPKDGNSLQFIPASSVLPGMVMFDEEGVYDIVTKTERVEGGATKVYDLNIERTHNFIANGLITHNCIYTWRGATIDNLLEFENEYPGTKTIVLENNYRSTKNIVDAANQVIEKNRNRKEKRSVTDNREGEPICIAMKETAEHEACFIAQESLRLMRGGVSPEEIAVLYRTNFQSRALEDAFLQAGIQYRLLGTQFYDRKEVKDVIAWVRLALEPNREADHMRAVQAPARGIGKVTLGKLLAGKRDELKPGERAKVEAFEKTVATLHEAARTVLPSEFIRLVIEGSGMKAAYEKGADDDLERLANAQELATLASRHDDTPGIDGISAFLGDVALAGDQDELDRPQGLTLRSKGKVSGPLARGRAEKKGVTLMTVHAAKGLEFDVVFVSGLEEGLFPHEGMGDEERDEEEERRLFYVAITRARSRLYLTLARVRRIYGTDYLQSPSSFLYDIDPSLIAYTHEDTEEGTIEL